MIRYITSIIIVISLIIVTSTGILAADNNKPKTINKSAVASKVSNSKIAVDENILLDLVNMPLYHIEKAREYFLKKDEQEASANEIRISEIFVRLEAERTTSEEDKAALLAMVTQLDDMASDIEKGSIGSIGEFDYNILMAGEALANYHTTMAKAFLANNEAAKAGYELKAATDYTQHGYNWSDQKMDKETDEILNNGQILAGNMISGSNFTPEEANKSIKGVNTEIKKLKENTKKARAIEKKETPKISEQK